MNEPAMVNVAFPSPNGRGDRGEGLPPDLRGFARQLRKTQSRVETLFWYLLRDRRFGGFKFRRQHPVPPYVLDFYCEDLKLAIELDGGQHADDLKLRKDRVRDAFLERKGLRVIRFWNNDVLDRLDDVLDRLWAVVHEATPSPGASRPLTRRFAPPSPKGRGQDKGA